MSATNWEDAYRVQTARIAELWRENAELNATLDTIISADERAVKLWRAAHADKELVIPDRAKLVGWLLEQNASLRAHAERVRQANDRLVVENDALRKDRERLDWMASADYWADIAVYRTPKALRAAIDAARKEAQP